VALSVVEFLPFLHPPAGLEGRLLPVRRALAPFRSVNSYHLFAHMTLVRREAVIEGSADGAAWLPYEFRYKPGDPARPPPFVAPRHATGAWWQRALEGRSRPLDAEGIRR